MQTVTAERPYTLGHQQSELERLQRQGDFYGALTRQALILAGIQPGMRVLDAGCGGGDVTVLIARLVGPTGEVIAVDRSRAAIDATGSRVEQEGFRNVHLLEADVTEIELDAPVDAVVGRFLLMHVADPVAVVRRLASTLHRPGILLIQEMDIGASHAEPPAPLCDRMIALISNAFASAGVDVRPGLRLHDQFVAAGLPAPELLSLGRCEAAPAHASALMMASGTASLLPIIERSGLATAAELQLESLPDRLSAELVKSNSIVFTPPMITAWTRVDGPGEKPVGH